MKKPSSSDPVISASPRETSQAQFTLRGRNQHKDIASSRLRVNQAQQQSAREGAQRAEEKE